MIARNTTRNTTRNTWIMSLVVVSLMIFTVQAHGAPAEVWQTGQTATYKTNDDGAMNRGVAWPCPRFIDNGDGTVLDYLSGLTWLKNGNCSGSMVFWTTAMNYVNELNTSGTMNGNDCGDTSNSGSHQTDWRLPNRKEFISIMDFSAFEPVIQAGHPFTGVEPESYWSSSTYANNTANAWRMSMGSGTVSHKNKATSTYYVWAVRSGAVPAMYQLTLATDGSGSGTVTPSPDGYVCNSNRLYQAGTAVTLTATPDAGSTFIGWSGGGCSGTGDCTVTMNSALTVTATFDLPTEGHTLTVQKDGSGSGTVTSSPDGIDCGSTCTREFAVDTEVALTGTPDAGSALDGWTGADCPGNAGCTVTMDQDQTITATFNPDGDGDGISDDVENGGPNNGDGNNDGVLDSTQNNVATFQDIEDGWCTLVSPDGTTLKNVTARGNPSPGDAPAGQSFPLGFFGFTVQGVTTGDPVLVTLIVHHMDTGIIGYYKYGPTPDDNTDHWYQYNNVTISHSATDNQTVISLVFQDGQTGDADLTANGEVVDPGAPAANATGGDSGGGCSCNGSAIAGDGHKSGKADFDISVVLFAFMGVMLVFYRRLKRHIE